MTHHLKEQLPEEAIKAARDMFYAGRAEVSLQEWKWRTQRTHRAIRAFLSSLTTEQLLGLVRPSDTEREALELARVVHEQSCPLNSIAVTDAKCDCRAELALRLLAALLPGESERSSAPPDTL